MCIVFSKRQQPQLQQQQQQHVFLVSERADDQLRHGSRGHRHHNAGQKDQLPA